MRVFTPCQEGISMLNNFSAHIRDYLFNFYFLNKVKKYLDFLGINYYTRDFVLFSGLLGKTCSLHGHGLRKNGMGWEIYPEGLYQILHRLKKYKLKIFITENGTYEEDDHLRWEFILDHLKQLEKAIDSGIPIIGYLYWSLMDNFEWEYGFQPRFGLIGVNYKTFSRNIRDSAFKFAEVCRLNKLS
jgi:beta-glucosidase